VHFFVLSIIRVITMYFAFTLEDLFPSSGMSRFLSINMQEMLYHYWKTI
jgi:hypothetical protein